MGSAYHSLVDDFSSGLYNPGAFRINKTREDRSLRLFFNPAGMAAAFVDYAGDDRFMRRDDELTGTEALLAAAQFFKGAVYTTPLLDMGINLGEEILASGDDPAAEAKRFLSIREQTMGAMYSAFANLKIASTVSLGATGTLYQSRLDGETKRDTGFQFGVLLNPNPKLNVGIVYYDLPEDFTNARFELESIESDAVTGGISYYPDDRTVLSIDLRNLNKDDTRSSREIHAGFERLVTGRFALRGGYFRKKETDHDVYSLGIGILPFWDRISKYRNTVRNDLVSYTWITENDGGRCHWHVFSLMLRF